MTSTGLRVDNYSAMCNYVFRRGVEIIAEAVGKLSRRWRLAEIDNPSARPERSIYSDLLTRAANPYTTAYNFAVLVQSWAKGWGNGYAWILRRNDLEPVAFYPLHPSRVIPRLFRSDDAKSPYPWDLVYQIDGGRETLLPYEILHIKGNPGFDGVQGYNLVQLHENTLATAQAQNEFAGEFFQNGAVAGGLVELPPHLKADVVLKYQRDFQDKYSSRGNRHKLALVDSGVKFTPTTIDPAAAQLLDARKFSIFEIGMLLGVPPTVLGDLSHGTFSNSEQQQLALNMVTLHPVAENWRQELNLKLTPDDKHEWEYDLKALDAADTAARQSYLKTAIGGPWMTVEEGRLEEGLPPKPEGTIYPPANMNKSPTADKDDEATDDELGGDKQPEESEDEEEGRRLQRQVERRSVQHRNRNAEALLPAFTDALGRLATKEAKAVGGLVKHVREGHADVFIRKVEEFYERHREYASQVVEPVLAAIEAQARYAVADEFPDSGMPDDPLAVGYAAAIAERRCNSSLAAVRAALADNDPGKAADAVEAVLGGLNASTSSHELRRASNYFARECYRAAGCTRMRWVAHPDDPVDCQELDGEEQAIDQPFTDGPKLCHPPLFGECRCGIVGVNRSEVAWRARTKPATASCV